MKNRFALFLYDIFLSAYAVSAKIISPFNAKAGNWIHGRNSVWNELKKLPQKKGRVWFHCASLGEYEQALPLIEKLKERSEIVVTFFSPSGYVFVKKKDPQAQIFYLPMDSENNARKFLELVQPRLAVFVRYDLWYYYLKNLHEQQIKTILISAVFRDDDVFFKWYGNFFMQMLRCFDRIFTQDDASKKLLNKNGFENVIQVGDTRIDRVIAIAASAKEFSLVEKFKGSNKLVVIGSLEPGDQDLVIQLVNDAEFTDLKFVIAPHNVDKEMVQQLARKIAGTPTVYSKATPENIAGAKVLIIDNVGMLSQLYQYADATYIGGGFGEGLHNILEPSVWKIPVLFGPKHKKFIEAVELVKREGAFSVNNYSELKSKLIALFTDEQLYRKSGAACAAFIEERKGAAEKILKTLPDFSYSEDA